MFIYLINIKRIMTLRINPLKFVNIYIILYNNITTFNKLNNIKYFYKLVKITLIIQAYNYLNYGVIRLVIKLLNMIKSLKYRVFRNL